MGFDAIKTIMKEKGITQDELVELSGVPKGTLSKILAGISTNPTLDNVKAIARALNCSISEFDDIPIGLKKEDNIFIGNRIKERRILLNITRSELSELMELPEATISRYEKGEIESITNDIVIKLSEILDCNPAYVMGWIDEPKTQYDTFNNKTSDTNYKTENMSSEELQYLNKKKKLIDYIKKSRISESQIEQLIGFIKVLEKTS